MNTLREFIANEVKRREMSARQFADLVGVNHKTINKFLDTKSDPGNPSMEFLLKLSRATNTSIITLIELAYPEVRESLSGPTPSAEVLAERIDQLPADKQRMMIAIVNDWLSQREGA